MLRTLYGRLTAVLLVILTLVGGLFFFAGLVSVRLGNSFKDIEKGMVKGISLAMGAILILLVIGMLVGTWIQAGIVPAMISYGLALLSPQIFLAAACAICALVALATGSSVPAWANSSPWLSHSPSGSHKHNDACATRIPCLLAIMYCHSR